MQRDNLKLHMVNIKDTYQKEIVKKLQAELGIKNPMAVPALKKIVINIGVKHAIADKKNMEVAAGVLEQISGQKAKETAAKKSISSFKLREGEKIGLVVTLRGKRMYDFLISRGRSPRQQGAGRRSGPWRPGSPPGRWSAA